LRDRVVAFKKTAGSLGVASLPYIALRATALAGVARILGVLWIPGDFEGVFFGEEDFMGNAGSNFLGVATASAFGD